MARDSSRSATEPNPDTTPADANAGLPAGAAAESSVPTVAAGDRVIPTVPTELPPKAAKAKEATVKEGGADDRFVMVTVADGQGGTRQEKRVTVINNLWTGVTDPGYNPEGKKFSRSAIRKFLSAITGKDVAYQIVFAATKGKDGGPPKPEAAAAVPGSEAPSAPVEAPPAA